MNRKLIMILISVFLLVLTVDTVSAECSTCEDGLVNWYNMDGNMLENVTGRDNGTVGGATESLNAVNGTALFCDGTDAPVIAATPRFRLSSGLNFTIVGWFKHNVSVVSTKYMFDARNSSSNNQGWAWAFYTADNSNPLIKDDDGTAISSTTSFAYNNGKWTHMIFEFDATAENLTTYINNTVVAEDNSAGMDIITAEDFFWCQKYSGADTWAGYIDEWGMYNRTLTATERDKLANGWIFDGAAAAPPSVSTTINTSIAAEVIATPLFNITSSTYATVSSGLLSCTAGRTLITSASFHTQKLTGATTDNLSMRVLLNGSTVLEGQMVSLSSNNQFRAVGTDHIPIECTGTENITYQMKTDSGSIMEVHSLNTNYIKGETTGGNAVSINSSNLTLSLIGTSAQDIFNFSVKRTTEDIYISASTRTSSLVDNRVSLVLKNLNDSVTSPYWERRMFSSTDLASSIGTWVNTPTLEGLIDYSINAVNTDSTTTTINGTIIYIDLIDSANNTIQAVSASNPLTNFTDSITVGAASYTKITNITHEFQNGTSAFLEFQGTINNPNAATRTINYILNSTTGCINTSQRTVSTSGDYANIPIRTKCNGITPKQNVTFEVWALSSSGNVNHYDDSLSVVEATTFSVTSLTDTEDPVITVTYPTVNQSNGTIIGTCTDNNLVGGVEINNSNFLFDNSTTFENWAFDYSGTIEQNISVNVTCSDFAGNTKSQNLNIWVDNVIPECTGWENATVFTNSSYRWGVQCTDNNIWSFLIDCGANYFENQTAINTNIYNYSNSTKVTTNYTCNWEVADGHTAREIDIEANIFPGKQKSVYDNKIWIESNNAVLEWKNYKEKDRIQFEIDLIDKADYISFNVSSDEAIYIVGKSDYLLHLITGEYWIDFENNKNVIASNVERLEDGKVKVNLWFDKEISKVKFKSIGKLNIISGAFTLTAVEDPEAQFIFKRMSCDVTTTARAILLGVFVIVMVVLFLAQFWIRIPIFSIIFGFVLAYFAWVLASCFFLSNVLFIVLGLISMLNGIVLNFQKPRW